MVLVSTHVDSNTHMKGANSNRDTSRAQSNELALLQLPQARSFFLCIVSETSKEDDVNVSHGLS